MRRAGIIMTTLSYLPKYVAQHSFRKVDTGLKGALNSGLLSAHTNKLYSSVSTAEGACWNCGKEWENSGQVILSCPHCGSLRKINPEKLPNYFDLLDHPKTYQVDLAKLAKKSKLLQKKLHPDLFSQRGEEEKQISQEMSSLVNKALSTLQDPIERGGYILKLNGIDVIQDLEKQMTMDAEFLEEVMELNERLEEVSNATDWLQFRNENTVKLKELQSELGKAFNEENLEEAKIVIARMKYFDSLQLKLKELQSKIGVVE